MKGVKGWKELKKAVQEMTCRKKNYGKKETWFEEKCRRGKKKKCMEILWKGQKSEVKKTVCATGRKKFTNNFWKERKM